MYCCTWIIQFFPVFVQFVSSFPHFIIIPIDRTGDKKCSKLWLINAKNTPFSPTNAHSRTTLLCASCCSFSLTLFFTLTTTERQITWSCEATIYFASNSRVNKLLKVHFHLTHFAFIHSFIHFNCTRLKFFVVVFFLLWLFCLYQQKLQSAIFTFKDGSVRVHESLYFIAADSECSQRETGAKEGENERRVFYTTKKKKQQIFQVSFSSFVFDNFVFSLLPNLNRCFIAFYHTLYTCCLCLLLFLSLSPPFRARATIL